MALAAGTKLGSYEIIAPLGAGGMGEVYRARDPQLGRDVAIKVLPSSLSRDPDRLRRFEQEARAAAALNHPNILAVYQLGTHEGSPYLVSELLEGSTLREQLLRGPLPIRKAVDYGIQTARGLAAAHEKGIVHRDLKPENLFVTKDGRIKILDFGLAKLIHDPQVSGPGTPTLSEGTEPGVVLGTVGYMAPEQVSGHAADDRADLFAFGAILYEMLTGKRAFLKPTSPETMSAILNEEPAISQIVPAIPPAMQRVVQRCLEKSPEQRFHSASDLAFALEALSDAASSPTGAFAVAKSRANWMWIAGAVVAIVIAAGLAIWSARSPDVPVVESVVQLTNDGKSKSGPVETDGTRIYFNEGPPGSYHLVQASTGGGETGELAINLVNPQIAGLTGDGAALLATIGAPVTTRAAMWLLPLPAGEARKLGDMDVTDAGLFPDGRLLYDIDGKEVFVANKDGSDPRKLEELSKYVSAAHIAPDGIAAVSPEGKRLAGSVFDNNAKVGILYVANSNGTGLHSILSGGQKLPATICCPTWTTDGKYLLFRAQTEGRWDIWLLEASKSSTGGNPVPFRLTNGPVSYTSFVASRDGKQLFAIGAQLRGELVRYEPNAHAFVSFLGGISGYDVTFSRDGKWAAYLSYPEHTLWRSRADGSDRLQLTYPPQVVLFPRISPDGTKVAFTRDDDAYIVDMEGGKARKIADNANAPDWSPDENLLAVTSWEQSSEGGAFLSKIVDLRTGAVSVVPGSRGTVGAWFASQDTLIATANDQAKLALFDRKSQKWSDLVANPNRFVNWEVSADGKYLFYETGGNDPKIFRMLLANRTVEGVANLKDFRPVNDPYLGNTEVNVSPDNLPVLTRDVGTQEVYAITVKWP
jgi:serine/threonine protein kinase/Tol biopolymer transport system component